MERDGKGDRVGLDRTLLGAHALDSVDRVLQTILDQAVAYVRAYYGAVVVLDEAGEPEHFVTAGTPSEARRLVGVPSNRGLISVVLDCGERLRLDDLSLDPRRAGFPPGHPIIGSLLAVPIPCEGPRRGGFFVGEKSGEGGFSGGDEVALSRFSLAAAVAIEHTYLHERLRTLAISEERERISREIHDGVAQLLAYVNAKTQAVDAFLQRGRVDRAREQLQELAQAARCAYDDARAAILDLRTELSAEHPLAQELAAYVKRWETEADVSVHLVVEPDAHCPPMVELQLLRIIQQALANVREHACASRVDVLLSRCGDRVAAIVRDDGLGFDILRRSPSGAPHFGLGIMRERAESVGGRLHVTTCPGRGTTVAVEIPGAAPGS